MAPLGSKPDQSFPTVIDVLAECQRLGISMQVTPDGKVLTTEVPDHLVAAIKYHRDQICKLVLSAEQMFKESTAEPGAESDDPPLLTN